MFDPFDHEDSDLTEAIANAHRDLEKHDADSEEYRNVVNQLTALYKLKYERAELNLKAQKSFAEHQLEQDKNAWSEEQDQRPFYMRVDPNTALTVAGNFVIAIAVIKYEQRNVIATKVMSFMRKI